MPISESMLQNLALNRNEYDQIVSRLGREPNHLELGLFGALWSEHCGYKHTKLLLKTLPNESPNLMVAPGSENAGIIDLGTGHAIAIKIESHNHPSAIEPFEGAATGVGGIVRDIFAMGARPIALLNSLRFGSPDEKKTKHLFNRVVSGISSYGNCIGVPDIGGEVSFHNSYNDNPLVNAMCIGLIENGKYMSASAKHHGDLLLLVGSDTGRDGIHGASELASRSFEKDPELRSAVQVGNPFMEKNLIEACLESISISGVNGLQDCGAAGLTSAAIEMANRSNMGLMVDVDKVPRRETNMTAYEVMLSESQERMLLAIKPKSVKTVTKIFMKWDLEATVIGEFTKGNEVVIRDKNCVLSKTPIKILTDPPLYHSKPKKPLWISKLQSKTLCLDPPKDLRAQEIFLKLLGSINISSRKSIYQQFDFHVQTNTVIEPGGDGALLRIKGSNNGLAISTDCNSKLCYLDPYIGSSIAVAEACRNVSVTGAYPLAITNGLNFGNPEKNDIKFQINESVRGISYAAKRFKIPVVSGNVSLYNETDGTSIFPTPIIGVIGLIDDVKKHCTISFKNIGDLIYVIGTPVPYDYGNCLSGSEYMVHILDDLFGRPEIDIELEIKVQETCRDLIKKNIVNSAHDCSDGGLAIAIAECGITGNMGAKIEEEIPFDWHKALFGESQSRIIVSIDPSKKGSLEETTSKNDVPFAKLGITGGDKFTFGSRVKVPLALAKNHWENGLNSNLSD